MIRRILVALDLDSDTQVATQYALEIARRNNARVTGLAVVDMGSIESSSIGGGIGSMYYAGKIKEKLTDDARQKARSLTAKFEELSKGVDHREIVEEGVPFERIVYDMKFNDLLIVGDDPHFFYSHPKEHTNTLFHVVEKAIGPTLVVKDTYRTVKRVLVAYDCSDESTRALRRFLTLRPFGTDIEMFLLYIHNGNDEGAEFELSMAQSYCEAHGLNTEVVIMKDSDPKAAILSETTGKEIDLIVIGSHIRRGLTGKKLGPTTSHLLQHSVVPVFMDH